MPNSLRSFPTRPPTPLAVPNGYYFKRNFLLLWGFDSAPAVCGSARASETARDTSFRVQVVYGYLLCPCDITGREQPATTKACVGVTRMVQVSQWTSWLDALAGRLEEQRVSRVATYFVAFEISDPVALCKPTRREYTLPMHGT